ncbi:MAG: MCE family protein [Dokdonella sp.]|uniref:MlaD family protein n=1 Tax=Dokdonella sp. TaxID=2291710 RepID=UPI0025B90482|nr:MlaD family protein [Dokdonella sp.]MBX3700275.1 MCE family protein [Dokdonella sp.]MCW5577034.1 MCE family protein [Dokdonella sp.]
MKRDTVNYTLVGAVVLAGAALLLVALALITGRSLASNDYLVRYRNVTGLRHGAPVFYEGYRVGQVGAVTPERSAQGTRYKVELKIRRDWSIPADSVAQLQSSGLLADVSIGIREGGSPVPLKAGGEMQGEEGGNVFMAMNDLATEINALTRSQIEPLIRSLSQRVDSIGGTLDSRAPAILDQAQRLLERLNDTSLALGDVLKPENRKAVATILAQARDLTGELRQTRVTLDQALADLAGIAHDNRADIRDSVEDLTAMLQALSSRMDVISHHLDSTSRNMDAFSREIRMHPNRLIVAPKADRPDGEPQ